MPLSSADAFDLADRALDASIEIRRLRNRRWDDLKPAQRETMKNQADALSLVSDQLLNQAIRLVLDETAVSVAGVRRAAQRATAALKTLGDLRAALDVAAALAGLAGAVLSENPAAIAAAAKNLLDVVGGDDA